MYKSILIELKMRLFIKIEYFSFVRFSLNINMEFVLDVFFKVCFCCSFSNIF